MNSFMCTRQRFPIKPIVFSPKNVDCIFLDFLLARTSIVLFFLQLGNEPCSLALRLLFQGICNGSRELEARWASHLI